MSPNHYNNRSREEELRRQAYYNKLRQQYQSSNNSQSSGRTTNAIFNTEYSEFRMRRLAPFAFLIYAFAVLFLVSYLVTRSTSTVVKDVYINPKDATLQAVEVPTGGSVYQFHLAQHFPYYEQPLYSELEVQVLNSEFQHQYSVYKDLWQEAHNNGEGGRSIYRDLEMDFELELPEKGTYYVRAISYNNNNSRYQLTVGKRMTGGLYFGFYTIVLCALSLILLLGSSTWGSPETMYRTLPKLRSWRKNKQLKIVTAIFISIFIGCWVISITHFGYAKAGDKTVIPTKFYKKQNVIYIG